MSRQLVKRPRLPSSKSIGNLAVFISVCPFTEQDFQYFLDWFRNPPDTEFEYSIAFIEYLRAAILSCVTAKGIRPIQGITADIRIEQWKDCLMYSVKRVSSTELSLEDSWQAFVQSLNEHLGIETDKSFIRKQLSGEPFKVYTRAKSPSTLELGVPSSHKIEKFRELSEKEASSASLDSAKAFRAAFWNEYHHPGAYPSRIRDGAVRTIREAWQLGHENDLQSDEWESPLTCAGALSHDCPEELRAAAKRLAKAREVEAKEMERAEDCQHWKVKKLTKVGFGTGIQSIDDESFEKPPEVYLSNLKRWEKRLTKLLNLERVQNEHCWQEALDFVRQQRALYSKWRVDDASRDSATRTIRTLPDTLKLWCENTEVARSQVQEFNKRLEVETETHPHFQRLVEIILEWSQHCLDHAEKEKQEFNKRIDNTVKFGASYALSALERFRDVVDCVQDEWNQDSFKDAVRYSQRFYARSEEYKAALKYKGMEVENQSWLKSDKKWAELVDKVESMRVANQD
eukprot:Blabericola_migrator_1__2812@NODE_1803_length_3775_cov_69_714132_g1160_i0_p1_GENE_NODE_1803_length_3775_cov_69_714132_g1160_i0NODE_1803_length_3775_cov_69_714132_g1160_i0_p1_ORF_typecomplete_len514_score94_22CREPT/PF16566_5/0_039JHD/PF17811_1/1e04JHD/PF17811_1/2_1e03JHD/PF17811_1/1_1_NODE_1803_length_3775_cov_69_714132_g1160_i09922533